MWESKINDYCKLTTASQENLCYKMVTMHHHHHHHIVLAARISLTLFRHSSLSFIALGRSSGQQPVSSHSCWMYVRAGRPAFARPCVGIHKSTSLMSSSLLTLILIVVAKYLMIYLCRPISIKHQAISLLSAPYSLLYAVSDLGEFTVIVIIVQNGIGEQSSNMGRDCVTLWKSMNLSLLRTHSYGKNSRID